MERLGPGQVILIPQNLIPDPIVQPHHPVKVCDSLSQSAKGHGLEAELGSEDTREMKRVGEARLLDNLFDQWAGLLQAFSA